MKSVKLIFGTHNSQPVGNFDFVNERIYEKAYKPFLRILNEFPDFPVTLHYSGTLLEWFEDQHPELLMLLHEMVKRKQVEVLGGGFHEPIFSIISNSDKLGQIECLTTYIRSRFGKRPRGSWVTERVWEPYLASILQHSGMEYVFLDDTHFHSAGLREEELYYPYLTEDQGKTLGVFPINRPFCRALYEKKPEELIDMLRLTADESGERVVTIIDDGEKLGEWVSRSGASFQDDWLSRFFALVQENRSWIKPIHPAKYIKRYECRGKIYIGCMLYDDMRRWLHAAPESQSLNSPQQGNLFRKFMSKYPESNLLYSKMIFVTILVNQIRGDKYKKKAAKEELWKGQCHCVYWHGNFDGIYANHLRKSAYQALIEAEKLTRDDGVFLPSIVPVDFDMDGKDEYLYQGEEMNAYVHTGGGTLFELDWLTTGWNYLDTLSRYHEPYHHEEARLKGYDWYLRKAFIDHFFSPSVTLPFFQSMAYSEEGDFVCGKYGVEDIDRENFILVLSRPGKITSSGARVHISKVYTFDLAAVKVEYTLINKEAAVLDTCFGVEVNLSPGENSFISIEGDEPFDLQAPGVETFEASGALIRDDSHETELTLTSSKPGRLWSYPLETWSRTLSVQNQILQGRGFLFLWNLSLPPGGEWKITLNLTIS